MRTRLYCQVKDFQSCRAHQIFPFGTKDNWANGFLALPAYAAETHTHSLFVAISETETLFQHGINPYLRQQQFGQHRMDSSGVNHHRHFHHIAHIVAVRVTYLKGYAEYARIPIPRNLRYHYDTRCAPNAVGRVTLTVPSTDAWRAASAIS